MSRCLLVMRHAKSAWAKEGKPEVPDSARPLTGRGKRDAERQGEVLKQQGVVPGCISTSPAKRARSTAKRVAAASGYEGEIVREDRLYMQGAEQYLRAAAEWPDEVQCGLLIGHNPDVSMLVQALTGQEVLLGTAAIAQIQVPIDSWSELLEEPTSSLAALYE